MKLHTFRQKLYKAAIFCAAKMIVPIEKITKKSPFIGKIFSYSSVNSIVFYRKFISPNKGYKCAYAACTGGPSCSDVGLEVFKTLDFPSATAELRMQFYRCHMANTYRSRDLLSHALSQISNTNLHMGPMTGGCCCLDIYNEPFP